MKQLFAAALLMMLAVSCSPKLIKGTDITDTPENREVLEVMFKYIDALRDKKVDKILPLVSEKYYDRNGTDDAGDDVDYQALKAFLESKEFSDLLKIEPVIIIKDLKIEENTGNALILYYYEVRYKKELSYTPEEQSLLGKTNEKWMKNSDVNKLILVREASGWKIISGM